MTDDDRLAFARKLAASQPPKAEALDLIDTLLNPEVRDALILLMSGYEGAELGALKQQLTQEMSVFLQKAGHQQAGADTLARHMIEAAARRSRVMVSKTGNA